MALQSITALSTITFQESSANVTFSNIPNTYKDLIVTISGTANTTGSPSLRFNGDSSTNYDVVRMYENGSTGLSQNFAAGYFSVGIMSSQSQSIVEIFDYAANDKHKTAIARGGNYANTNRLEGGTWKSLDPITSVEVGFDTTQIYQAGTVISLYGRIA